MRVPGVHLAPLALPLEGESYVINAGTLALPPKGGSYNTLALWHVGTFTLFRLWPGAGRIGRHRTRIAISEEQAHSRVFELVLGDRDPCRPRERGPATLIRASPCLSASAVEFSWWSRSVPISPPRSGLWSLPAVTCFVSPDGRRNEASGRIAVWPARLQPSG